LIIGFEQKTKKSRHAVANKKRRFANAMAEGKELAEIWDEKKTQKQGIRPCQGRGQ